VLAVELLRVRGGEASSWWTGCNMLLISCCCAGSGHPEAVTEHATKKLTGMLWCQSTITARVRSIDKYCTSLSGPASGFMPVVQRPTQSTRCFTVLHRLQSFSEAPQKARQYSSYDAWRADALRNRRVSWQPQRSFQEPLTTSQVTKGQGRWWWWYLLSGSVVGWLGRWDRHTCC
jgi:hypothetical protein